MTWKPLDAFLKDGADSHGDEGESHHVAPLQRFLQIDHREN